MIILFTDFGLEGPYIGLVKAEIYKYAPGVNIISLFSDAPTFDPEASAYLLSVYSQGFPSGSVFLGVVDPGVGSCVQHGAIVLADERWYVGPDNGLFNMVAQHAREVKWWTINWRPMHLSRTFYGRDLYAPVAAKLARGDSPPGVLQDNNDKINVHWPLDLAKIIYVDCFGNCMTGMRAHRLQESTLLTSATHQFQHANTFSDVDIGEWFWYENSNGLAEIAVNQGRANQILNLKIGDTVNIINP